VPLTHPYHLATKTIPLHDFIDWCATAPLIGLDTESNGEPIRDGRGYAQGLSLSILGPTGQPIYHYLPFRHRFGANLEPGYLAHVKDMLDYRTKNSLPFSSHNSLYDIPSMFTLGIDLSDSFHYDTLQMCQLIDEITPFKKSLENCIKHYTKLEGKKDDEFFTNYVKAQGWGNVPSWMMYEYGAWDAELHRALKVALEPKWNAENLETYWRERKIKTIPVANKMMNRGVKINVPLCEKMTAIGTATMGDLQDHLGFNPASTTDLHKVLIDELKLPVVKWTDGGKSGVKKPSFDKYAMEIYEQILERQDDHRSQLILEYRGWQKSVSSNYKAYLTLLSPDGRLRPGYKLHSTKTLRWACENPNLQQIPRVSTKPWNGAMKQCFIAKPGYLLLEADYSQLEFRIAAAYGMDQELLDIFADDTRDVFSEISAATGSPRHDTKLQIYSTGYGAGPGKVALILGISEQEALRRIQMYNRLYPGIRAVSQTAMNTAKIRKKIKIWSGRYRHFNHWAEKPHKAFNAACQGGGADVVEDAMHRLYRDVDSEDCRMLLQVHDSVVFEVREDLYKEYSVAIKEIMEDVPMFPQVRFKVDCHLWGE
jgi:DNA polymerase I-like protein with 3'-5' exonuclease and polymerase domains